MILMFKHLLLSSLSSLSAFAQQLIVIACTCKQCLYCFLVGDNL